MKNLRKLTAAAAALIFAFAFAAVKPVKVQAATDLTLSVSGDKVMLGTTEIGNNDGTKNLLLSVYADGDVNLIVEGDVNLGRLIYGSGDLVIKGNGTLAINKASSDPALHVARNLTITGNVAINTALHSGGFIDSESGDITISGSPTVVAAMLAETGNININITGGEVIGIFNAQNINLGDGVREKEGKEIVTLPNGTKYIGGNATFIYDASNQGGDTGGNTNPADPNNGGNTGGESNQPSGNNQPNEENKQNEDNIAPANEDGATTGETPADPAKADPKKAPKTGESNAFVLSMLGIIAVAGMGLYVGKRQEN